MLKNIFTKAFVFAIILFVVSCDKDDSPDPENEEETITKAVLVVTNTSDNSSETYNFEVEGHHHDHDDDHADDGDDNDDHEGEHMEVELESNSTYLFEITFFNESDPSNSIDLTKEIIEEADEHVFFYELTDSSITIESAAGDTIDSSGDPIHLKTEWTTTSAAIVDIVAYLIHEPITKTGVSTRTDLGGSTDAEIEFEAHVE
jgi:type VI protein secretion system component Hcp